MREREIHPFLLQVLSAGSYICSPGAVPWALPSASSPDKDHQLPTDGTHWVLISRLLRLSSSPVPPIILYYLFPYP